MHVCLLPAFADNYIFALQSQRGVAVVDPGDAGVVEGHLAGHGADLLAILVTHHHPDHIGGLARLTERWPRARRIGPADPRIPGLNEIVGDGDRVVLDDLHALEVLATPGHTRSHIVYRGDGQLFCGDVLFSLGCGRVFEGVPAQMLAALDRIAALPDETEVYCAHEYTLANARFALAVDPDNAELRARIATVRALRELGKPSIPMRLGDERRCNPFLRCDDPIVVRAAQAYADATLGSRAEVFAALRAWKNAC
ncbi:MAG: hydroxyacylglutathione hydrolase [Rhodanobacteraceae bacterium]|nr:hydroxyacylglutathione hydrolase [Rhodanobacteraceae bacterium]